MVVEARKNGSRIPWSYWHDRPLTVEEYLAAPMISDPISRFDCDIPVDGVATFVLTTAERATDLPHRPVYVAGYASGAPRRGRLHLHWPLDDVLEVGLEVGRRLWASAGVDPSEVDLPQLYDGFSPFVWLWLEVLGFCPVGEGHRFVLDGGIDSDAPGRAARPLQWRCPRQRTDARGAPDARVLPAARPGGPASASGRGPGWASPATPPPTSAGPSSTAPSRSDGQGPDRVCRIMLYFDVPGGRARDRSETDRRRPLLRRRRDGSRPTRSFPVESPADETTVADAGVTPLAEVERAILEARRSFDEGVWADLPVAERAARVRALLDHVEAEGEALVATMMAEAGQPRGYAEGAQLTMGLELGRSTVDLFCSMAHEDTNPVPVDELTKGRVALSVRRHEPVGVVSAITPYNGAVIMAFQKLVPALLAGNSVILRPSPLTPLSSLAFGAAAEAAGIPPGVLSVVLEEGSAAAELLTTHPAVDMVSFTGSTAVGRQILAQAAPTVKRVSLELGGKSAQIYLDDALDLAGMGAMVMVAMTSGQACVAATRMLVPQERKDEVIETVSATYASLTVGDPQDPSTLVGPLINAAARERCERYVALAEEHGGKVAHGGGRPAGLERGYYFEPTVLDLPDNANPAAQDEIFGPVLGVIGYEDVDHAVAIANDSPYGLSAQVYGKDVAAATAVGRRLRAGAVNVNTSLFSAYAAGGGYKQSGLGRERGPEGIREFQEVKHMAIGAL